MGKKKSVVLMTLLTIVIVVLSALTVFPSFAIPETVKKWNPAIMQYDLGKDLGGGYYTYYYPEGVIPETEYKSNLEALEGEEQQEYADSYLQAGNLYLDKDEDMNIVTGDGKVASYFEEAVADAADAIALRFAAVGYSDYRVSVVDKYSVKVELPASDTNAGSALTMLAYTGEMTVEKGGEVIDELKSKDAKVTDIIKDFSVTTQYNVAYVKVSFTKAGKEMLNGVKDSLSSTSDASTSTDSSSLTSLDIKVGDNTVLQILSDHISDENVVKVPLAYKDNKAHVEMVCVLLDSVLNDGGYDISFRTVTTSDIRTFDPVYGEKVLVAAYIALAVVIAAVIAYSIVKMGRFGVVNTYATLSYLIVTGLCFAFITKAAFEITFGSLLIFLVGLLLVNALNARVYNAVKAEFDQGKTVESAVKGGYNKTLWSTVDIYAVLLLGALALLIGAAGVNTLALQALICVVTAAFCNLLWSRAINFVFLSASKNKYKYFRFVREDDDDE